MPLDRSGSSCSKLTTSLVNVSLKFQMIVTEIYHFLLKKCEQLSQDISVFGDSFVGS